MDILYIVREYTQKTIHFFECSKLKKLNLKKKLR